MKEDPEAASKLRESDGETTQVHQEAHSDASRDDSGPGLRCRSHTRPSNNFEHRAARL